MVQIEGKYAHEKNENLDEYYKSIGVPFLARKMILTTHPTIEIKKQNEEWIITTITLLRSVVVKFKLGEEYEEHMPGGAIKSTTTLEDDKLVTHSVGPNDTKITRVHEFNDEGCKIYMKHDASGIEGIRYFKRVAE